LFSRPKKI